MSRNSLKNRVDAIWVVYHSSTNDMPAIRYSGWRIVPFCRTNKPSIDNLSIISKQYNEKAIRQ